MNENKELLVLIHENVKMGLTSTKKLLSLLLNTNNKIKMTLESELKTYESLYNKTKKEIKKQKITIEKKRSTKNTIKHSSYENRSKQRQLRLKHSKYTNKRFQHG